MMISYSNLFAKTEPQGYIRLSLDHKHQPRRFILLETPEARRYAGFTMMKRDLDLVLEAVTHLAIAENPVIIQQSLFFFLVVTYAKCFASNEANRPKLDVNDVFKNADMSLKKEHEHILQLRNSYVAHAGAGIDRCAVVATVVDVGFTLGFDVNCQLSQPFNMTPKLEDFQALCEFVKQIIQLKIDRSLNQVMEYLSHISEADFDRLVIKPDPAELYQLVPMNPDQSGKEDSMVFVKV